MLRYSKDGITVLLVQDRRRAKKNGLYPIKVEVVYARRQKYYGTGKDMSKEGWKGLASSRRRSDLKTSLENSFQLVARAADSLACRGEFSFSALDQALGRGNAMTLNAALSEKMTACLAQGRINTYYLCRNVLLNIVKFGGNDIDFRSVTPEWLGACDRHWRSEHKSVTTINIYMKVLKSLMNDACRKGHVKKSRNPFGKGMYEIPRPNERKLALSKEHIKRIMQYKGSQVAEKYRDLWVFSYLCNGINFRDMLFLKYGNIINGEICFFRSKTKRAGVRQKEIRAVLTEEMIAIIRKWGNRFDGNMDTYIFKYAKGGESQQEISNIVRCVTSQCNQYLAKIADALGIPRFTTYSARHSFATMLKRAGTDISFISESLGHSSLSMTQVYLSSFEHDDRVKNSKLLTLFD